MLGPINLARGLRSSSIAMYHYFQCSNIIRIRKAAAGLPQVSLHGFDKKLGLTERMRRRHLHRQLRSYIQAEYLFIMKELFCFHLSLKGAPWEGSAKLSQILKPYSAYFPVSFLCLHLQLQLHLALPLGNTAISSTISVYQPFGMAIWTSSEHGEEDTVAEFPSFQFYHTTSMPLLQKPSPSDTSDYPRTPRLDIGEIDAVPFSVCIFFVK